MKKYIAAIKEQIVFNNLIVLQNQSLLLCIKT